MPFDVAVEKPDARVIRPESQDEIAIWSSHDSIAAHWDLGEGLIVDIGASFFRRADDGLESVTVEMKWMFAGIKIIENDFDNLTLLEYKGVGGRTINIGVHGRLAGAESSVESWDLGTYIGYIIEPSARAVVSN